MRYFFYSLFLQAIVSFYSCSQKESIETTDYIIAEKDIIPEGVAFDPKTQTIFVSSTYKRKIIAVDKDGRISNFINEGQDDIKSVIGMEVDSKRNSLWAVSSEAEEVLPLKNPDKHQWWSSVYQFEISSGKLIKKYSLNQDSVFLNDITVGPDGVVYVTETRKNAVYKIEPGEDSLRLFLEPVPYTFLNGICFTNKPEHLFVSSTEGVIAIDLATKKYSVLPVAGDNKASGIDGLSFKDHYFIGHQSKQVTRFYLSAARDSIIKSDTLNCGKEFDGSTTGEVSGGDYYFIVNSQIQSGIDYKKRKLKPIDSLENIIIRKIKL